MNSSTPLPSPEDNQGLSGKESTNESPSIHLFGAGGDETSSKPASGVDPAPLTEEPKPLQVARLAPPLPSRTLGT